MHRHVLHLRVDAFPVVVEQLRDKSLRSRPVVVCSRHSPRALIYSASPEARAEGVFENLPLTVALKRCKRLVILPPDEGLYQRASKAVAGVLNRFSPLVEPGGWGRYYMDVSGMARLHGDLQDAAFRIRNEVSDVVRLPGTLGIASNKLVSGVAARVVASSGDLYAVPAGSEASFLAPLRVRLLPAVRSKTERSLLAEFNIRTAGQLAGISVAQLAAVFGRFGGVLHRQSLGIDPRPVLPPSTKSYILEENTLDEDSNDDAVLLAVLYRQMERACRRMRAKGVAAKTVWIHIRYADGMDATRRKRLEIPTLIDPLLFRILQPLFVQTDYRRQRIRYLSLTFTDLCAAPDQMDLFSAGRTEDRETRLVHALDVIRTKYGETAIERRFYGLDRSASDPPRLSAAGAG